MVIAFVFIVSAAARGNSYWYSPVSAAYKHGSVTKDYGNLLLVVQLLPNSIHGRI